MAENKVINDEKDSTQELPQEKTSQADEYLWGVIYHAEWIMPGYKKFAEGYKDSPKELRELYMCICDGVPLDTLKLVVLKEPVDFSLKLCRRKHLEKLFLGNYSNKLEDIETITADIESELQQMSGTVKNIAESIPRLDDMLSVMKEPVEENKESISQRKSTVNKRSVKPEKDTVSVPGKPQLASKEPKGLFSIVKRTTERISRPTEHSSRYVVELYSKGYNADQINFILECIEEGFSQAEIKKFADPKISVDVMRRLKKIQMRDKEDTYGKR